MSDWITDANGNRASVEYWGSEKAARASLETLKNCKNCTNCKNCWNCTGCTNCDNCADCTACKNCTNCKNCWNCTGCTNCDNCADCTGCKNCDNCTECTGCKNCADCTGCKNCNLSNPHVRIPVSEPRSYTWLAIVEGGNVKIRAGCRNYTVTDALHHWSPVRYTGPDSVRLTAVQGIKWAAEYLKGTKA